MTVPTDRNSGADQPAAETPLQQSEPEPTERDAPRREAGTAGGSNSEQQSAWTPGFPVGRRRAKIELSEEQQQLLQQPDPKQAWSWVKWILAALITGGVLAVGGFALVVAHYSKGLPSVAKLKSGYDPPQVTRILAHDDTLLASIFTERRTVVPFEQIPDAAKLAFLAAEDAFFYEHEGLNYLGMARALVANLRAGRTVQGGSTITQQVVKNLLLDQTRSYRRKIRETLLARRLEQYLTKDEIFWLYLNHIYLGHGRYGIEEATRYYFGRRARDLRLDEAALLAGLVAAPERFSPRKDPEKALARRGYVLNQMLEKGFVTQALYEQVKDAPLYLAPAVDAESELAPEAMAEATRLLKDLLGPDKKPEGYTVKTTIDPALQSAARGALRQGLDDYVKRHRLLPPFKQSKIAAWGDPFKGKPKAHHIYVGVVESADDRTGTLSLRIGDTIGYVSLSQESRYNPDRLPPSKFAEAGSVLRVRMLETPEPDDKPMLRLDLGPQAALVALDLRTRNVVAMVGSYEALPGGFNRATQARRQPGSTFKPITYSYALRARRFTPASIVGSVRAEGADAEGEVPLPLRAALARSDNQASVHIFKEVGAGNVVKWGKELGIDSKLEPDESLALGAYEVTPIEMANVYATFAAGGRFEPAKLIETVLGPDGAAIELPGHDRARRAMEADEAYLITSLLQSVVQEGTGRRAQRLGRPVAGKTGTTNEAKDAWFVGFSTDYAVAVWVGFDDGLPLGKGESGSRTALPIWIDFMKQAHRDLPVTDFARPNNIVVAEVDPATGLLPYPGQTDVVREEFLAGSVPGEVAPEPGNEEDEAAEDGTAAGDDDEDNEMLETTSGTETGETGTGDDPDVTNDDTEIDVDDPEIDRLP